MNMAFIALCGGYRKQPAPEKILLLKEQLHDLQLAMEKIKLREAYVVLCRIGLGMTREQLGQRMELSRERARQIYCKSLCKLKKYLRITGALEPPVITELYETGEKVDRDAPWL